MLANIAVLRTVKANVNEAIMVALPSILFESSHDKKDTQSFLKSRPAFTMSCWGLQRENTKS